MVGDSVGIETELVVRDSDDTLTPTDDSEAD